jgi:hypothetical protein
MTTPRTLLSALFLLPLLASGCDAAYPENGAAGFRAGSFDVNMAVSVADGGDDDGSILWEIVEVGATAGDGGDDDGSILWELVDTEARDGGDDDGTIIWEILEAHTAAADGGDDDGSILWEIVEVDTGATVCRVKKGQLSHVREHILLSRQSGVVLDAKGNKKYLIADDTLIDAKSGAPIVRVDADLAAASDGRVLTIAAMVAGMCRE